MKDIAKGLEILKDNILKNKQHEDYKRVTDLADLYLKLFTGENIDDLLKEYHQRTDPDMFNQVCKIYNSVMSEVSNNLSVVFSKIFRSNRIFSAIESKSNAKAAEEVTKYSNNFWSGDNASGLDAYLSSKWFHLQKFDPNAFLAVHFDTVKDVTKKTARIFPVEYSSKEVINFNYINGKLDWLIIKQDWMYRVFVGTSYTWKKGNRYLMYLDDHIIRLSEVDPVQQLTTADDEDTKTELEIDVQAANAPVFITIGKTSTTVGVSNGNGRVFQYEEFNHLGDGVPAKRIGYKLDPITNQRTCVSIFHDAVARFKKELKAGSELDLAVAMHLHAQKIQFADPCEGDKAAGKICKDGREPNGSVCTVCNGLGVQKVSTSSKDVLLVRRPRPEDPMPDLSKFVHYVRTDVDVIKFLYDMVNDLTDKAKNAVFGSQALEKKTIDKTATEMDYSYDGVYDTLHPFGLSYSSSWKFVTDFIAVFSDNKADDLITYHRFPTDFKFKTLGDLMAEAKMAIDSGLPQHIIDAINKDIAEILYADDKDSLTKIRVKNKFNPFSGKTSMEISTIITQNKTTKFNQVLYIHFNEIFERIDNETGDDFYQYAYEKQKETIKKYIDEISTLIDQEGEVRLKLDKSFQSDAV